MQKITNIFFRFSLWLTALFGGILLVMSVVTMGWYRKLFSGERGLFWEYIAVILLAVFMGFMAVWLYRLLEHTGQRVAVSLFTAMVILQIAFLVLVSHPMVISDAARVQNEALEMVKRQHGQLNMRNEYFQRYTNNHFILVVFYYFYKILFKCGITEVWVPTVVLNILYIDTGIYITYRTARRLKGDAFANLILVCFLLCPTTYVWLTTAYTNTFSFPFVMAILYLCLWLRGGEPNVKNVIKCILLGFAMAVGYWIRPTSILPIIAMILFATVQFFKEPLFVEQKEKKKKIWNPTWNITGKVSGKRNTLIKGMIVLVVFGICFAGCRFMVNRHVNQDKLTGAFPITHWIMMGLNEDSYGGFSRADESFTRSFPTKEEKTEATIEETKNRLKRMGVKGVIKQGVVKVFRVWAMGDDDSLPKAEYASDFPVLYEKFMGNSNGWYLIFTQAFRVCIFGFLCLSVIAQLYRKRCREIFLFTLTFLGAVLFFLIWEANRKYNICFMGVYLLLMADGIHHASTHMSRFAERRFFFKIPMKWCFAGVMVLSLAGSGFLQVSMLQQDITKTDKKFYNSRTAVDAVCLDEELQTEPFLVEQTIQKGQFATKGQWNRITIYFSVRNPVTMPYTLEYVAEIYSVEDMKCLYREKISQNQLQENEELQIILSKQKKMTERGYLLRLTHIGNDFHMIPLVSKFPALDPYPYGELSVNGRATEYDLSMSLEQTNSDSDGK
ncbi:MAG: hypothetical protein J1E62_10160 [Lachnospiraceae bacterium]|nr:hypothetical protein [Lachnospiraceae bacterium]